MIASKSQGFHVAGAKEMPKAMGKPIAKQRKVVIAVNQRDLGKICR